MSDLRYCVICTSRHDGLVRVVGPFESQDVAVTFASVMRHENESWDYKPDVLQRPFRVTDRSGSVTEGEQP